jgi:ADP-heptose:LPS heptosyltransferase
MPDPAAYDMYINLDDSYECNPVNHYLDSYFYRAFGTSTVANKKPELFATESDVEIVNAFFESNAIDEYIVVHIRQWYWPFKNMSWDTWYPIFEQIFSVRTDIKIVCVGTAHDGYVEHPLFVDARDKLSVQQQKLLMDNARCFVGTDSGPYHIASAGVANIISLHTHLLPDRILPRDQNAIPILSNIDCVGCNDVQERPVRQVVCKHGDYRCKDNFDAAKIANNILELL